MKKVLMIISGRSLGGTKQAFLDYARMLTDLGHQVVLVLRKRSAIYHKIQAELPFLMQQVEFITYHRSKLPYLKNQAIRQIQSIGHKVKPDIIICHKPMDCYFVKKALPAVKLIGIAHGFYTLKEANLIKYADVILPVSQAVKQHVARLLPEKNLEVVYNSVKMPINVAIKKAQVIPVIGTMCVFRRKKNLPLLLKACKILQDRQIDFKLNIAGSGRQKLTILYYVHRLGLSKNVRLLGWVKDVKSFLEQVDVFVVSSNTETFNIALIEAMAHKTPVISTACGGPNEIVVDGKSGFLVPTGDATALANKLELLLSDQSLRAQMAEYGYQDVNNRFSSKVIQQKIQSVLNGISIT